MPEGDRVLKCRDCGEEFVFTAGEQSFYKERGFQHEPTRCRRCRDQKKVHGGAPGAGGGNQAPRASVPSSGGNRELFEAVCSSCGTATQVPFRPTAGKPVYCRDCFHSVRTGKGVNG